MKIYLQKISKVSFLIFPALCFCLMLALPWHAPVFITSSIKQVVKLELVKPNGAIFEETFNLEANQPLELRSVSINNWKALDNSQILFSSLKKILPKDDVIAPPSLRFTPSVLLSISIITFGISVLAWFLLYSLRRSTKKELFVFAIGFFGYSSMLIFFMLDYAPGFYSIDMFYNYWDSSAYSISYFIGYIFSAFIIVGYQIFPSEFFIISSNIFFISSILSGVLLFSYKRKLLTVFIVCNLIFFLYPSNIPLSLFGTRDIIAHWFLCGTLLFFYYLKLIESVSLQEKFIALILIFFCCFIRQENIYFLIPWLIFFSWRYSIDNLKIVSAFCIFIISVHLLLKTQKLNERIAYQTTLLVNPLSSVLVNLYGMTLPSSVDKKLGDFYKNDYLVIHHNDDEIMSFHNGGMNDNQSEQSFLKFKKASIEIIMNEPVLFLKNRWNVFISSLGLLTSSKYAFTQLYYGEQTPSSLMLKKKLNLKDHQMGSMLARKLLDFSGQNPSFLTASYLIPGIVIITTCIILGVRSFYFALISLLLIRTGMVFLTAPASYFKYHYILWLFALFSLPFAIYEHRASLTNSTPGLKTQ